MSKPKALTPRDLERVLRDAGFILARVRGSHQIWRNATGEVRVLPANRKNRDLGRGDRDLLKSLQ